MRSGKVEQKRKSIFLGTFKGAGALANQNAAFFVDIGFLRVNFQKMASSRCDPVLCQLQSLAQTHDLSIAKIMLAF